MKIKFRHHCSHETGISRRLSSIVMSFAFMLTASISFAQSDALNIAPSGNVGIGTATPERQLHMIGSNAAFRMDRDRNTAAFILVRTDTTGQPLKTFVVGVDAAGEDNGAFIINDLGSEVGGPGVRRMTIDNNGNVIFTGTVSQASSLHYKRDIREITDASQSLQKLRGVEFVYRNNGEKSLGLIAEEIQEVYPELVSMDDPNNIAVNYSGMIAVLLQAFNEQKSRIDALEKRINTLTEK